MFHKLKIIALPCALALISSACVEGSEPTGRPVITRSALEQDVYASTRILDPGTGTPQDEIDKLGSLFESFEKNAPRLLRQNDLGPRVEMIERAYITSGRYMDLVAIYRKDVEEHGLKEGLSPIRLTWAMVRLGQEDEAKRLLGEILALRPTDADAWFLYGAYWIKYARSSSDAAKKVVLAWRKVVELDPNFRGFEGINAPTLKRETDAIAKGTPILPGELELLEATLTSKAKEPATSPTDEKTPTDVTTPDGEAPSEQPGEATPDETTAIPAENAPVETVVPEDVAKETTPVVDNVAETAPSPTPPTPEKTGPEPMTVLMGRAQLALAQGENAQAAGFIRAAISAHAPEGKFDKLAESKQGSGDIFALVRISWQSNHDRNGAARAFRGLATRVKGEKDATLTYEMAMFAWKEMEDRPLAIELFEQFASLDPERARSMNIDKVIDSVRSN